jgi:hypothetical protein
VGRDGGPNREDDDGEESLAAESHVRWPEEKTSPSPRRTSSDADPLGAPVVVRNTSGTRASPAENDRATDRGPPSRRPAAFDPLENLSDAWRFIRGDDFSSLAGMDGDTFRLADAFGEHGGGDALTAAVDDRNGSHGSLETELLSGVSNKRRDENRAGGTGSFSRRSESDGFEKCDEKKRKETRRTRGDDARTRSPTKATDEHTPPREEEPSEAARKTAIQKKHGGGLGDVHKAVTNVLRLLAREMKPLGMEGVATFDPLSGLFLWREHRRFAAARKRAVRELYREDVDDEFGARGRGRDEEERQEAETKATEADARRRTRGENRKPPKKKNNGD